MKPNGKTFVVRMVLFTVCAICLLSDVSIAQTARGTFKLPVEAHWGNMMLVPGEYEFVVDTASATHIITVRSKDKGWTGMVLSSTVSEAAPESGSTLKLAMSKDGLYVQTLHLDEARIALNFAVPKTAMSKFAKTNSPAMSSASGSN